MQADNVAVLRVRVVAEADPSALVRALQLLQARNIVPLRVNAQRIDGELLEIAIEVDAAHCTQETFRLVVAKINELSVVLTASVCE